MITHDDSETLLALMDAARGRKGWQAALALMRAQMQADRVVLLTETLATDCTGPTTLQRPSCFMALRPSRAYGAEELADRAGPFDPDFTQGDTRVIAAPEPRLWLWVSRARGQFRAADSARLTGLLPHVAQAVGMARDHALQARALLAAQTGQRRAGLGQLTRTGPDAIAAKLLGEAGLNAASAMTEPGRLRRLAGGLSAYGLPDGTVLLRATRALPADADLARALGLTLSEARLARALGQGQSLPDASAALGLTRETGRSYAKRIYAKTGVNGQPALMRLLWCGALAFG